LVILDLLFIATNHQTILAEEQILINQITQRGSEEDHDYSLDQMQDAQALEALSTTLASNPSQNNLAIKSYQ
jgi:hypothetical protein